MARIVLRNPRREVSVEGRKPVKVILRQLELHPDTVLVIRGDELLTQEDVVEPDDDIEIRPVISGGMGGLSECSARSPKPDRAAGWGRSAE